MFLLFVYPNYYPSGGMNDAKGIYDTLEEAKSESETYKDYEDENIEIYDVESKVVHSFNSYSKTWTEAELFPYNPEDE